MRDKNTKMDRVTGIHLDMSLPFLRNAIHYLHPFKSILIFDVMRNMKRVPWDNFAIFEKIIDE